MKKNKFKRNFRINSYQRPIILTTLMPLFIISVLVTGILYVFFTELQNLLLNGSVMTIPEFLQRWLVFIVGILWAFFIFSFLFAYNVSLNLVGAFKRIIREVDEILSTGKPHTICYRKKDVLARDVVERINKLVARLPYKDN